MPNEPQHASAGGFHDGELVVQRRAGVATHAARLSGMLAPTGLSDGIARFLAGRTFAALTACDRAGRLWVSPLTGPPGFLAPSSATTLAIDAGPAPGDPLHAPPAGQPVGLVVIEFTTRRRVRINGSLAAVDTDILHIDVEQAYGNCPQYIRQRHLEPAPPAERHAQPVRRTSLTVRDATLIRRADTFFVGTAHPGRGADASHRGGPPGFVRVENDHLWWPDYTGNNMFNTLGNLAVEPAAALLFADFTTGATLQLSGTATVAWTDPGIPGDDDGTGRRLRFVSEAVVAGRLLPLRALVDTTAYHGYPPLTDERPDRLSAR